jgi:hypothetical protein
VIGACNNHLPPGRRILPTVILTGGQQIAADSSQEDTAG